ncbi:uncharacterized protein METZ01_LOCUS484895, partial [marine metagenome]
MRDVFTPPIEFTVSQGVFHYIYP